ncbi:MAG TPA: cupin domain-containing protein [Burkholderiaceae bacterium]|nr:cupin domain-containing protein [Burkholderiaceae bacterium]
MDTHLATPLLGGLSPHAFMRRHWQKKPLLVRGAYPGGTPPIARQQLFELAARDDVQSRLVVHEGARWSLAHGPFARRALPPLKQPRWTLLVQGVDLHLDEAHRLLMNFRFVPDARLDDLMVSYASDGGGVGPHVDSYDVFLLQLRGRRRWRVGPCRSARFRAGLPLKILERFEPQHDWLLEPGDMLYLPPGWAHDGVAEGECLTASIGFRAAGPDEVAQQVLQRLLDAAAAGADEAHADAKTRLYRDPAQPAADAPGRIPQALQAFAADAVTRLVADRAALECSLGEWLSEPAAGVSFDRLVDRELAHSGDAGPDLRALDGVELDRRTRMLYDDRFVFINGESFRAGGRDATLMRRLADRRCLYAADLSRLGDDAGALLHDWLAAGWLHPVRLEGDYA